MQVQLVQYAYFPPIFVCQACLKCFNFDCVGPRAPGPLRATPKSQSPSKFVQQTHRQSLQMHFNIPCLAVCLSMTSKLSIQKVILFCRTKLGGMSRGGLDCRGPENIVAACSVTYIHRESKKRDTILLSIASTNIDRFSAAQAFLVALLLAHLYIFLFPPLLSPHIPPSFPFPPSPTPPRVRSPLIFFITSDSAITL